MEVMVSLISVLVFAMVFLSACSAGATTRPRSYKPDFSHSEGIICDRGKPIAKIEGLHLKSVVLAPGAEAVINDWDVSWQGGKGRITIPDEVSVRQSNRSAIQLLLGGRSAGGHYSSTTKIKITYSKTLGSYIYDVESTLVRDKMLLEGWQYSRDRLVYTPSEYCRLKFAPARQEKWNCCVYRHRDGELTEVPFHYLMTPDKDRQYFPRKDAFIGWFGDPEGQNPVVELVGLTGLYSYGHISASLENLYLGRLHNYIMGQDSDSLSVRYRLCRYDRRRSAPIVGAGRVRKYTDEEKQEYARPRFNPGRVCGFEKAINPTRTDKAGYWDVFGDILDADWCDGVARNGRRSLKCAAESKSSRCYWELALHTKAYPILQKGRKYRVTAYVKTKALDGKGAVLECIKLKGGATFKSQPVTGTTGWKKLVVDIPPSSEATGLQIRLLHEGKGESYFDDVQFTRD